MAKYIKLGPNAESFNDPYSELSLAKGEVVVLTPKMEVSNRVRQGLSGGHLSIASERDYEVFTGKIEPEEKETISSKFGSTAEELLAFYKKTYEVTAKDVKAFNKKSLEGKVKYLIDLEEAQD
jgi:hypothetical protein